MLYTVTTDSGLMKLQNTNSAGYSSVDFLNNSGTLSGTFGYGNSSVASPYTGRDYFSQYGNDFIFSNNPVAIHFFYKVATAM